MDTESDIQALGMVCRKIEGHVHWPVSVEGDTVVSQCEGLFNFYQAYKQALKVCKDSIQQ